MDVMQKYKSSFGQLVNLDKSQVSFSQNVIEADAHMTRSMMGVKEVVNHSKNLGLPVVYERSKRDIFAMVIDKV